MVCTKYWVGRGVAPQNILFFFAAITSTLVNLNWALFFLVNIMLVYSQTSQMVFFFFAAVVLEEFDTESLLYQKFT